MKKQFLGNLALIQGLNLLVKPLWILGIDRAVQNTLPHADYGIYFTLNNLCLLLFIIPDFGITSYNSRMVARDPGLLPSYFRNLTRLKFMLSAAYLVFVSMLFFILGFKAVLWPMLMLIALNQVLISFNLYLRSNLTALHLFKTDSIFSVLDKAVAIITCGLLLWYILVDQFTIWWFILSQTFGMLVTLISCVVLVRKKAAATVPSGAPVIGLKVLMKESLPYAVLSALMTFFTRIDGVLLERLLDDGAEQAARYASGFRLLDAVNMFAILISGFLLPLFSRMISKNERVTELSWMTLKLMLIPSAGLALLCIFFNNEIMGLMYTDYGSGDAVTVFSLLMTSFVPFCLVYVFGTLATAMGHIRNLNTYAVICVFLNLGLNFFLIPAYETPGAAMSTLITQVIFAGLCIYESRSQLDFSTHIHVVLKTLGVIILMGLCAWLFHSSGLQWYMAVAGIAVTGIAASLLFRLFSFRNIMQLFAGGNA